MIYLRCLPKFVALSVEINLTICDLSVSNQSITLLLVLTFQSFMSFDIKTAYKEPSIKLKLFVVMRDQINSFREEIFGFR